MTAAAMNRLVRNLSHSLAAERLGELPDVELLRRINGGDGTAFEAVVRRHGAAVLAAARVVLTDETDVEDVFQAAFLALWRNGQRVRNGDSLAPWLFGVARRAALKALARSKRRRQVEQAKPKREEVDPADLSWREACRLLHEEIERLPEQYRGPIVLCHLEGRSRDEAAAELGWKLATLRGRLERGREMLKRRLTRRGVALSAGLLAWLAGEATEARELPAALISAALRARDGVPTSVAELLSTASPSVFKKAVLAAVALVAAGVLSAGLAGGERRGLAPPADDDRPAGAKPAARPPESGEKIVVNGHVVDPNGKPVPGAKINAFRFNIGGRVDAVADGEGKFTLALVGGKSKYGNETVNLVAVAPGHAPFAVHVAPKPVIEVTARLAEGVPLEGRISTLEGQPVAGADVRVTSIDVFAPGDLDKHLKAMQVEGDRMPSGGARYFHLAMTRYGAMLGDISAPAKTDANGRFRIPNVGRDRIVELNVIGPAIQHVNLVTRTQAGAPIKIAGSDERRNFVVLASAFEHLARPARLLHGVVRDRATGKPVAGVIVTAVGSTSKAVTDVAGRYELGGCPKAATYSLTAVPPADKDIFVAERRVADTAGLDPLAVDFDLLPGIRVTGKVLDNKTGKSVSASVEYFPLPDNKYLDPKRDATGTMHRALGWRANREDFAEGYLTVVAPGPGLLLVRADHCKYLDACIDPSAILPGQQLDRSDWGDKTTLHTPLESGFLMIPQREYQAIEPINPAAGTPPFEFDIGVTPAAEVRARFLDPDGKPLTGVWTYGIHAGSPYDPLPGATRGAEITIKGVNPKRPSEFYAYHAGRNLSGMFTVNGMEKDRVEFRLQPACTLTGRMVDRAGNPLAGQTIHAHRITRIDPNGQRYSSPHFAPENSVTDADGRFSLRGLLPHSEHTVNCVPPRQSTGRELTSLLDPLKPGETRDLGTLTLTRE
jgi:RNA polymerase sigma factor (sigma-70 family)